MKIAIVCHCINEIGGVQKMVAQFANQLSLLEDVSILTFSGNKGDCSYKLNRNIKHIVLTYDWNHNVFGKVLRKLLNISKFDKFVCLTRFAYYNTKLQNKLIKLINNNGYDFVIGTAGTAGSVSLAILFGIIKDKCDKCKLIGWQHSSYERYFTDSFAGQKKIARLYLRQLDHLVVLTQSDAVHYRKSMDANAVCIYNAISFVCSESSGQNNKKVIFVGRLVKEVKGLDYLIAIIDTVVNKYKIKNWSFQIVGDGPDRKELEQNIKNLGISKYVNMIGETKDVIPYYLESDILINTSKWEGFGLTIAEAMECGLAAMSFKTAGPSEIICDNRNGYLIENYNIDLYSEKLAELMSNIDTRKAFSIHAKKRAKEFSLNQFLSHWYTLLEENRKEQINEKKD